MFSLAVLRCLSAAAGSRMTWGILLATLKPAPLSPVLICLLCRTTTQSFSHSSVRHIVGNLSLGWPKKKQNYNFWVSRPELTSYLKALLFWDTSSSPVMTSISLTTQKIIKRFIFNNSVQDMNIVWVFMCVSKLVVDLPSSSSVLMHVDQWVCCSWTLMQML